LGCVAVLVSVGVVALAAYLSTNTNNQFVDDSPADVVLGLLVLSMLAINALGLGLGIGALVQSRSGRAVAISGIVVNALIFISVGAMVCIGLTLDL